MDVFLLLGTNLGDRNKNLVVALDYLVAEVGSVTKKSSIYQTDAWGKTDQPAFYNQVIEMETSLDAHVLLERVLGIEKKMGRIRKLKWGERIIDIDILFYGDAVIETAELVVPHPQLDKRRFTLVPLSEVAADFVHPVLRKKISELLVECMDGLEVVRIPN